MARHRELSEKKHETEKSITTDYNRLRGHVLHSCRSVLNSLRKCGRLKRKLLIMTAVICPRHAKCKGPRLASC